MDNERIKQTMEQFGISPMCLNCRKCKKRYTDVTKSNTFKADYNCQVNDNRDIAHPHMHCHKWEPNTNMLILFGAENVERPTAYEKTAIEQTDEQIEAENQKSKTRIKTVRMHGIGATYQMMHDDLKKEMEGYEKEIAPLESKERALKALIYENAKPSQLPHYKQQLSDVSAKLDTLYLKYEPMKERLKELYNKAHKYTYWVPGVPKEEKPKTQRPKTIQEFVDENMPTNAEIIEFLGLGRLQKIQARVEAEIRRANAYVAELREEREKNQRKATKQAV